MFGLNNVIKININDSPQAGGSLPSLPSLGFGSQVAAVLETVQCSLAPQEVAVTLGHSN